MRVLLVEDESLIAEPTRDGLSLLGHEVELARNGQEALVALHDNRMDIVCLDLGLPDIDGLDLIKLLRQGEFRSPIVVLTARDSLRDRVRGLDVGADDYLVKPVAIQELDARIRAILRRRLADGAELVFGPLALNRDTGVVLLGEHLLAMQPRERELLEILMRSAGDLVRKEALLACIEKGNSEGDSSNTLDVYLHRIRRKLEPEVVIRAIRGFGYRIELAAEA